MISLVKTGCLRSVYLISSLILTSSRHPWAFLFWKFQKTQSQSQEPSGISYPRFRRKSRSCTTHATLSRSPVLVNEFICLRPVAHYLYSPRFHSAPTMRVPCSIPLKRSSFYETLDTATLAHLLTCSWSSCCYYSSYSISFYIDVLRLQWLSWIGSQDHRPITSPILQLLCSQPSTYAFKSKPCTLGHITTIPTSPI